MGKLYPFRPHIHAYDAHTGDVAARSVKTCDKSGLYNKGGLNETFAKTINMDGTLAKIRAKARRSFAAAHKSVVGRAALPGWGQAD
jgi:hypothetical protein